MSSTTSISPQDKIKTIELLKERLEKIEDQIAVEKAKLAEANKRMPLLNIMPRENDGEDYDEKVIDDSKLLSRIQSEYNVNGSTTLPKDITQQIVNSSTSSVIDPSIIDPIDDDLEYNELKRKLAEIEKRRQRY